MNDRTEQTKEAKTESTTPEDQPEGVASEVAEQHKELENEDFFDKLLKHWWGKGVLGVFLLSITAHLHYEFSKLESGEVEQIKVSRLMAMLYDLGGRWAPVVVFGAIGLISIALGIHQLITKKE